ncbi:hypothetical protein Pelo_3757 [Pelomyxa schiedti]|nr:hypothetical protein Pelo_3757 [Pelomyxa schiedti]
MGQTVGTDTHNQQHSANYAAKRASLISAVKGNKLLTAAAKAQPEKLAKLAARTPVGHEIEACRIENNIPDTSKGNGAKKLVRLNLMFVCAALGHLEELKIVHNAWHERVCWEDKTTFSVLLVDSMCTWRQWYEGTAFACAVNEGHAEVARFLLEKCRANPRLECDVLGDKLGNKLTALHFCIRRLQPDVIDMILSACDIPARVKLLCETSAGANSPLKMAMCINNLEVIQLLVNEKWGGNKFIEALDAKLPIAVYCGCEEARPDVLQYLCQVFHKGLGRAFVNATQYPRWSATNKELLDILVNHPNFTESLNSETENRRTPLFMAILRNHRELAMKFLTLGANPNAPCSFQLRSYEGIFTPMILAVILDQSELVAEMARLGGVLPSKNSDLWRHYQSSEYDHIHEYLKLLPHQAVGSISVSKYSEIIGSTDALRASMPVMEFEKLPSHTREMVSASVGIDDSITAMAALYQAEIAGVLALLDVQSLGRIQQTSRFWYHVGRSNSCWKKALLNSSATWSQNARIIFSHFLNEIEDCDQIKWKHVSFVWMARNYCTGCGYAYRCCDGTKCAVNRPRVSHTPAIEYPALHTYYQTYDLAWSLVVPQEKKTAVISEFLSLFGGVVETPSGFFDRYAMSDQS